jgi:hypothetical protein
MKYAIKILTGLMALFTVACGSGQKVLLVEPNPPVVLTLRTDSSEIGDLDVVKFVINDEAKIIIAEIDEFDQAALEKFTSDNIGENVGVFLHGDIELWSAKLMEPLASTIMIYDGSNDKSDGEYQLTRASILAQQ